MPFDEEVPKEFKPRIGLKNVPGQKSMFDGQPKKQTPQEFQQKVQAGQESLIDHKQKANEFFNKFVKVMSDKTLLQNKNILHQETEKELLQNMIQLSIEINNDPNEQEGMGSLTWIILLLKICLAERDRINQLEYTLSLLTKKMEDIIPELIKKEINIQLDKLKKSE